MDIPTEVRRTPPALFRSGGLALLGACLLSGQASAALVLNQQTLADGAGNPATSTLSTTVNNLTTPSSTIYGNTFSSAQATFNVTTPSGTSGWGFYDDYFINIGGSSANSITSTIDLGSLLGISNLEVRLYGGTTTQLGVPSTGPVISSWSSSISTGIPGVTGTVAVINPTVLAAGNYVLEVRGIATGQAGGAYAGAFNLAAVPVPLPAAVWLFGSALTAFGVLGRKQAACNV